MKFVSVVAVKSVVQVINLYYSIEYLSTLGVKMGWRQSGLTWPIGNVCIPVIVDNAAADLFITAMIYILKGDMTGEVSLKSLVDDKAIQAVVKQSCLALSVAGLADVASKYLQNQFCLTVNGRGSKRTFQMTARLVAKIKAVRQR